MSKAIRTLTLGRLVTVLTFMAILVMAVRAPVDTDMYWHLRAGQWQTEQRALLRVDLFSHTRAGQPWINHSWLSQLILYGAYAALGDVGLALYTAVLATVGMAFIYPQLKADALVRAFVMVLATATAAVFWSARPQMVSFALSAAVLYLLWLWREKGIDRLWVIVPLMALWANLHGGFAIGFILLALALVGELARWLFEDVLGGKASPEAPQAGLRPAGRLVVVGIAAVAAVAINPYGPQMLLYPFRTVGIGALRDFIQEWASPNFHNPQNWPFLALLVGTLGAAGVSSKRLDWREAALVGGTAAAGLLAGRNIATFAIAAAPVLALHLDDWLAGVGLRFKLDHPPRAALLALNGLLLVTLAGAGLATAASRISPAHVAEALAAALPVEAVRALETEQPPGKLFNSYNWGGYLIWAARDYPVYVDGRTDLYDDDMLSVYVSTYFAQPGWDETLAEAGINTVLVETSSPLARVLEMSGGWRLAYGDDQASLYVREVPLGD